MRKGTKIALAAGAFVLAGGAGLATLATAEYRGGWRDWHHGHHWRGWHRGPHWGAHRGRRFARLMERFDTNKDGRLTQAELDEARKALLAKHDANKDGKLTLSEFEPLWLEAMRHRMVRGFQRFDGDGDAQVTVEEFLTPFANLVMRLDRNGDGVVDKEDRMVMIRQMRRWRYDDDMDRRGPDGPDRPDSDRRDDRY